MDVELTPDQQALVRDAVESGRLQRPEQVVQEALSLWEERERRRLEILASVEAAEESLATGRGRVITSLDETRQLADDVKKRGLAWLRADDKSRRR
jgi:hypothetical protein